MSEREWRFYLDDMIRFAENVLVYCSIPMATSYCYAQQIDSWLFGN